MLETCKRGHPRTLKTVYSSGNCKLCSSILLKEKWKNPVFREKKLLYSQNYQRSSAYKRRVIERKYNLPAEKHDALLLKQNNACAICSTNLVQLSRPLNVDHDHQTNAVRGLLCGNCNTALGLFHDNISVIRMALSYLGEK